jgi:uncharacterized integral membrane protein
MSLLRIVVLGVIVGSLILFAVQNGSVPMSLVFLGMRSPALPLPIWILGAIAAGILTTIVLSILFGLTGFTARRSVKRAPNRTQAAQSTASSSSYSYTPPYTPPESPRTSWKAASPSQTSSDDDWDEDASDWFDDSSDWADERRDSRPSSPRTDYEVRQQPKSEYRSGSNYSYSYRDPDPPTANPPDVVDADYRVIIPPTRNLDDDSDEPSERR